MYKLTLIFLGSGLGGVCRYALSGSVQRWFNSSFPAGTLAVNVLGCLVAGFLTAAMTGRWLVREEHRVALVVGVLGGFTTFSAFGVETFALINERQHVPALCNVGLNVGLGLAAAWLGVRFAEGWLGA